MSELKLNKLLKQGLTENGIQDLYEYQTKLIRRINGGGSVYLQGPSGTGKTTAMIIAVLQKLNYSQPDTPRAILMLSTGEDAAALYNQFKKIASNMDLIIHLVTEEGTMDDQNMAIYAGADIIIGTPVRLTKLYFQCGINVNKVNLFILDEADKLVTNRQLVELDRFADSLPKFQGIVIDQQPGQKIRKACEIYMQNAVEMEAALPESD